MKKILLVEDDPFLIDIYQTKLREAGFAIEVAKDGREAWDLLKDKSFDLLVLDIVLPNIDGWMLLEKIKRELGAKKLKIIILSNLSQKSEVEKGLALGASKYLIKAHFTPAEVIEEIKKILAQK
jgi:DNA-binding response OmpR family regulator